MRLSKYHSCENTFLITMYDKKYNYNNVALNLCSKEKYDVDGLLVLKTDPIEVLIFNKDGSEARMCGNGLNCMTHYCYDKFKIYKYIKFKTKSNSYECEILKKIPFYSCVNLGKGIYHNNIIKQKTIIKDIWYEITMFELGVLHAVIVMDDLIDVSNIAIDIFESEFIKRSANIDFVKIIKENTVELITYEKGVGFTKACGTGASSVAFVLNNVYGLDNFIDVITEGGVLKIEISDSIYLNAESVFVMDMEEEI